MSWQVIAKRDVLDPVRSRSLAVLAGVYVVLFGAAAYFQANWATSLASLLVSSVRIFVPLTAFALGYQSIVKGRQNGSLRVILGYPHTRREVVFGRAVGRSLVMAGIITVGFIAAALVYTFEAGVPALVPSIVAWGLALLLGVSMACFAVGISASVRTTNRAVMLCFGAFLLFLVFWRQLPFLLRYVFNGFNAPQGPPPEWTAVFTHLEPLNAYRTTISGFLPGRTVRVTEFYTTEWFGILVILAWLVLPVLVGLWRFNQNDL